MLGNSHPAITNGKDREDHQRQRHRPGGLLCVFSLGCPRFAQEGQRDLTHGVKGSQEGSNCQCPKNPPMSMAECIRKNLILRPKARRNQRETSKRKTADQECPKCDWHLPAQTAHVEHVLRIYIVIARV